MPSDANPLRHGCDDNWTWDRRERSPEVKLQGPNFRIAYFHPNWSSGTAGVRGTRVLNNGRYFWELYLSRRIFGTSMMFGVGKEFCFYYLVTLGLLATYGTFLNFINNFNVFKILH